jgi:hemerythrin-like metal-binding protein
MDHKFVLGISDIDLQHAQIFKVIQSLHDTLSQDNACAKVLPLLLDLQRLLVKHMADEESLMQTLKCPDLLNHKSLHVELLAFLDTCIAASDDLAAERRYEPEFADRLSQHILNNDIELSATVENIVKQLWNIEEISQVHGKPHVQNT